MATIILSRCIVPIGKESTTKVRPLLQSHVWPCQSLGTCMHLGRILYWLRIASKFRRKEYRKTRNCFRSLVAGRYYLEQVSLSARWNFAFQIRTGDKTKIPMADQRCQLAIVFMRLGRAGSRAWEEPFLQWRWV